MCVQNCGLNPLWTDVETVSSLTVIWWTLHICVICGLNVYLSVVYRFPSSLSAHDLIILLHWTEGWPLKSMLILFLWHNHFWGKTCHPWYMVPSNISSAPLQNEWPAADSQLQFVWSGPRVGCSLQSNATVISDYGSQLNSKQWCETCRQLFGRCVKIGTVNGFLNTFCIFTYVVL